MARSSRFDPLALAALLLLVGVARHYGWDMAPAGMKGLAAKGLGAAAVLALLSVVWTLTRARIMAPVLLWWAWEELQVLLCSAWYAVEPWPILPEQPMCSARAGFDLGAAGILAVAGIAAYLSTLTANHQSVGMRK